MQRYQSMTTDDGWILCAKCGHKLARVMCGIATHNSSPQRHSGAIIELKCHSCKALNIYGGEGNGRARI